MKNKTLFKAFGFIRKLGLKPKDITIDTKDGEAMEKLATAIFGAVLSLPELEDEYYDLVTEIMSCTKEEAEEMHIIDTVMEFVKSLKGSGNFSGGALEITK